MCCRPHLPVILLNASSHMPLVLSLLCWVVWLQMALIKCLNSRHSIRLIFPLTLCLSLPHFCINLPPHSGCTCWPLGDMAVPAFDALNLIQHPFRVCARHYVSPLLPCRFSWYGVLPCLHRCRSDSLRGSLWSGMRGGIMVMAWTVAMHYSRSHLSSKYNKSKGVIIRLKSATEDTKITITWPPLLTVVINDRRRHQVFQCGHVLCD